MSAEESLTQLNTTQLSPTADENDNKQKNLAGEIEKFERRLPGVPGGLLPWDRHH